MRVEPGQYAHAFVNGEGNIHGRLFGRLENPIQKIFMDADARVRHGEADGH